MKQYVTDENGNKTAVILDYTEFENLLRHIDEMEDALDLKKAVEAGGEFIELKDFLNQLQKEDRI